MSQNHNDFAFGAPEPDGFETPNHPDFPAGRTFADRALWKAYSEGRDDQLEEDKRLLAWAYRKLMPYSFSKQEDALAMDEIKLILEARE